MSLETEQLERLATDRALGVLADDVEALFDAYLGTDAHARALADEFADAAHLAERCFQMTQPSVAVTSLPPFPLHPPRISPSRHRVAWLRTASAAAACLVAGAMLGAGIDRHWRTASMGQLAATTAPSGWPGPRPNPPEPPAPAGSGGTSLLTLSSEPRRSAGLWSEQRLLSRTLRTISAEDDRPQPAVLKWKSPARLPPKGR